LVFCYYERGDLASAHTLAQAVIEDAEREGSPRARAAAYWNAAIVAEARNDLRSAQRLTDRALALYGEVDNARAVASLRVNAAWLMLRTPKPDHESAYEVLVQAHRELTAVGSPLEVVSAETEMARCRLLAGDPADAEAVAEEALRKLDRRHCLEAARVRAVLATAQFALGKIDLAVETYAHAVRNLDGCGSSRQAGAVWRELADALSAIGRVQEAMIAYRRAADAAGLPGLGALAPGLARTSGVADGEPR
jgi:tetratricopeptide (TPR) repeat protein